MIRSFSAVGQWRRRSTLEMTSQAMYLTVLSHVLKDSILHLILVVYQAATAVVVRGRILTIRTP
jgi:hypothetical protein